ncbi:Uroporphyrinogen-III synthase [Drechslerella dactyloides]|uniref:Uroporphyrinogen-III synthase n=1 Tax=Drechslerella dactyloides TaxID=74499 RepID=A0AAD6IYK4_DREDA|nr:Uroporphyrinogen-III synthase [Drechslerella dactyloides]
MIAHKPRYFIMFGETAGDPARPQDPAAPPSSRQRKTPVLLLKTKSSPTDPYDVLFTSTGTFEPIFIPVLQHRHVNTDVVRAFILDHAIGAADDTSQGRFSGLVITSQRTVEALGALLEELKETDSETVTNFLAATRIYVVGPATGKALVNLGFTESHVVGAESGNGAVLADYIIDDYVARNETRDLLFLVGETHNTIIPMRVPEKVRELMGASMSVEEVVVYTTGVAEGFAGEFRACLNKLEGEEKGDVDEVRWIIVFSPTGTDAALNVLEGRGEERNRYKICTIGPTTRDFLWQKFRRRPEAVAKTPSPEGLLEAVKEWSLGAES